MHGIKDIKKQLDKLVTPKIAAYNEPSFANGVVGTLHGKRSDLNGYQFLRIQLYGSPKITSYKGCKAIFSGSTEAVNFVLKSDSQEIDSYYSEQLQKGITEVEFLLDNSIITVLRKRQDYFITLDFGRTGWFKREKYQFALDRDAFLAFFEE